MLCAVQTLQVQVGDFVVPYEWSRDFSATWTLAQLLSWWYAQENDKLTDKLDLEATQYFIGFPK